MLEIAVLWLINKENEILLAKRSLTKSLHPGVWGPTVTGTAEVNETPIQTLVREVKEELGLKLGDYNPNFLFTTDFNHSDGQVRRFNIYYALVEKEITNKFKIDTAEVADMKWLSLKSVKEFLITPVSEFELVPSAKTVWPKTFEMLENVTKYITTNRQ